MSLSSAPLRAFAIAALTFAFAVPASAADSSTPTLEELMQIIQKQQSQIEELRRRLDAQEGQMTETDRQVQRNQQAVEATADAVEVQRSTTGRESRTRLGGYGELHANFLDDQRGGEGVDQLDFHRFVLFLSHEFSDKVRFYSELEFEHAFLETTEVEVDGGLVEEVGRTPGELELEQAYLEFDLNDRLRARGGVFLLPVGLLNLTHEPPTFYGVERNPVERDIIPATWWEGGAGLDGELGGGFSFDVALHSGLKTDADHDYAPRAGRQKVAEAVFRNLAATARLKYTGVPGLELAASLQYQDDITQGNDPTAGGATLFQTHADWRHGAFGLRALYARWDLDGAGPEAVGADQQYGFYVEPSWRFTERWGVFTRFSQWDNAAGNDADTEFQQWDLGVNYWPLPNVVIKADYQNQNSPADRRALDGFGLSIGYQF